MKKLLALAILSLILFGGYAEARCKYDSTGRHLIYDDTIRGRRRAAAQAKLDQQKKFQAAAAAKINYLEEADEKPVKKPNYIQCINGTARNLPPSSRKSNFIQSKKTD